MSVRRKASTPTVNVQSNGVNTRKNSAGSITASNKTKKTSAPAAANQRLVNVSFCFVDYFLKFTQFMSCLFKNKLAKIYY